MLVVETETASVSMIPKASEGRLHPAGRPIDMLERRA